MLTAETVNGSILLALPADASAVLDARNLNGKFHSDLPLLIAGAYGSREIHGRLGSDSAAGAGASAHGEWRDQCGRAAEADLTVAPKGRESGAGCRWDAQSASFIRG